jgi:hypothetical protein
MSGLPEDTPREALCLIEGHHWVGGQCTRCYEQLRCGACMRFVTIDNLHKHINEECPVRWIEYEGASA